jgi:hypothetical protein
MDREGFFKTLYQFCEGTVELRALPSRARTFIGLAHLDTVPWCTRHQDQNLFFGVGTRDGQGGGKENLIHIPAVWTDLDFKETPKEIASERLQRFPFQPSIVIVSGGGVHFYWLLKEPVGPGEIPQVEEVNRRIASYLGGDMNAVDAARILRVPDTLNHKYEPPRPVRVHRSREQWYEVWDFLNMLPEVETKQAPTHDTQNGNGWLLEAMGGVSEPGRNATAAKLAGYWINKVSAPDTLTILRTWNTNNTPPMNDAELERTVKSVSRYEPEKPAQRVDIRNVYTAERMVEEYRQYVRQLKQNRFVTGITEIDKRIRGVSGGEVLTILARAGSFKTAMLQVLLQRYASNSSWASVFFSLEMPVASMAERYHEMLGGITGTEVESLYTSTVEGAEQQRQALEHDFCRDLKRLFVVPVKVDLSDIASYVRLIEEHHNVKVGVIGIDYLGLLQGSGTSRYDVISSLSTGTKDLAKMLNIPTILLAQVSRKGGAGETEVSLDMGRDSGAIEEGADFVLGLWRQPQKIMEIESGSEPAYDLICRILKNRKGPPGSYWRLDLDASSLRIGQAERWEPPKRQKNHGVEV